MSYEMEPAGSNMRCFFRGPRVEEITQRADQFLLFADCISYGGVYYVCDFAYNDGSYYLSGRSNTDQWHAGGVIVGFLDGHAALFPDIAQAYLSKQIYVSTKSPNK